MCAASGQEACYLEAERSHPTGDQICAVRAERGRGANDVAGHRHEARRCRPTLDDPHRVLVGSRAQDREQPLGRCGQVVAVEDPAPQLGLFPGDDAADAPHGGAGERAVGHTAGHRPDSRSPARPARHTLGDRGEQPCGALRAVSLVVALRRRADQHRCVRACSVAQPVQGVGVGNLPDRNPRVPRRVRDRLEWRADDDDRVEGAGVLRHRQGPPDDLVDELARTGSGARVAVEHPVAQAGQGRDHTAVDSGDVDVRRVCGALHAGADVHEGL